MKINMFLILIISTINIFAQRNLDFYLTTAIQNSPALKENTNLLRINELNKSLNEAQYKFPQIALTSNYLFAPYFNNNGKIVSANPDPNAIGYDAGITNGGLYSAQINIEKNIFNGGITSALENQTNIQQAQYKYSYELERRNLQKQITDQYISAYKSLMLYQLSKEITNNVEEQLKFTGELVEKGYAKSQGYLLLKIELQSQKIAMKEMLQQYKNNLLQLNSSCGIKDTQTVFVEPVQISMNTIGSSFSFLEKYKLDSMATSNQQELFETKYNPQVKLFFNTGLNAVELDGIQRKFGMSAGVDFMLPIYDGGQKSITRQQNEITTNSIQNYKQFAASNIEVQRQSAVSNIQLIKNRLKDTELQLNDYKNLIQLSNKQLQTGDISMIEYLTILRNFVELRKTQIEKETNLQTEINNYNYWN
ncbi:MAG: TolC family protein [Melioribacteraceae bacterium]